MSHRRRVHVPPVLLVCILAWAAAGAPIRAAEDAARPTFSLATTGIATTRETPSIYLTFRELDHLDFRVYRVNDPVAFLAGLKDPHQLGSEEPAVDQVPTSLERIADWKASWRVALREFVRRQFSADYRHARREQQDKQVVLRRTTNVQNFAQVPLLNASQLVTSWREILPPLRDVDARRIPIDVKQPGMYVVEAVSAPHRAYTVVIVSDIGLVSKASPGQVLLFAADRLTGKPVAGCAVKLLHNQKAMASGTTGTDGVFDARFNETATDDVVSVATCGAQVTATDPGSWYLHEAQRDLVGYIYTDKPIYRPGHTVHIKGVLRWRAHGALQPFDAPEVEVRVTDVTGKVIFRQPRKVDAFGGVTADLPLTAGAALGDYSIAILRGDDTATGAFEVQEYRKPEFEVHLTPADTFVLQDGETRVTISARYYFGQPVAGARVTWVAHRQPYYSPLRWSDDADDEGGTYWYGEDQAIEGAARLDANGRAEITLPVALDERAADYSLRVEARVADASSREVTGLTVVHATYGTFLLSSAVDQYVVRPGAKATVSVHAVDYLGAPQANLAVAVSVDTRVQGHSWDDDGGVQNVGRRQGDDGCRWSRDVDVLRALARRVPHPRECRQRRPDRSRRRVRVGARRAGEHGRVPSDRYLELIPEKKVVVPGETARFMVKGAEFDADVLVTKEAQDVGWHNVVHVKSNETIDVPVTDDDIGDTWVNIAFLNKDRLYRAERRVKVPAVSRQLKVSLTAEQAVSKPREPGKFLLKVTDASGAPVRGSFSLAVVDEAVYGVKADDTPDPLRFFYQREYSRVGTQFSREYSFVGYSGNQTLLLAMTRRPVLAGGLQGREARAAAGTQGVPRRDLLDGRHCHGSEWRSPRAGDLS